VFRGLGRIDDERLPFVGLRKVVVQVVVSLAHQGLMLLFLEPCGHQFLPEFVLHSLVLL
jgi:hypothetical protein